MTVLVTGGAGYVGSHVAVELLAAGHGVVVADNFSNSSRGVIDAIGRAAGRDALCVRADMTDINALDGIFADHNIGGVIHCAGLKAVGESAENPLMYYRVNVAGALNLLEAMRAHGVKNLIFSSSATVYGDLSSLPLTEAMASWPCANPYGTTKLVVEKLIEDAAAADGGMSAVCLRYFNPVGAHPSALLGESPNGVPNNLMPYIVQVAAGRREYLTVFGGDYPTRDGTGVRDYIHVSDLARGHIAALSYCMEHKGAEAFNLGSGAGYSVLELVAAFERANGVKIPFVISNRRAGDVAQYWACAEKAKKELGWTAELSLDDMCRDAWRYAVSAAVSAPASRN
ncbi:MAG: UDP-glucose 4-epimerase GalE [Oscillospiraceae bacterium]|nr:UDP-glucose 4-epimerase GalE [Oscillospiraceae bacterium]